MASHIDEGEAYIRRVDGLVREAVSQEGERISPEDVGHFVFSGLGLPEGGLMPIVVRSFAAHLESEPL